MATAKDSITVTVDVKNNSKSNGSEVVEVYASAKNIPQFRAVKSLIGFVKTAVKAGETKKSTIRIAVNSLRQFDEKLNDYKVFAGEYEIGVGESSGNLLLTTKLKVN